MRRIAVAAAALMGLATSATAQTPAPADAQPAPIVTSASATPAISTPPTYSSPDTTAGQISAWIGDDSDSRGSSVPGVVSAMPAVRDRAVHGEVGASIGSGGYRSAYGIVNMPLGENSDVTVAIGDQHLGGGNRGRGYGYGGGYGYRGGDRQSLGIALNLNGVGRGSPNSDCDRDASSKWSLSLPDDAALSNRCRRLLQADAAGPTR